MLLELQLENLAIIDQVELEFSSGINVFTGETGAGKSILLNGIKLVLGAKATANIIKENREKAEIRALFDISERKEEFFSQLKNIGIDIDDTQILLTRIIYPNGKSKAYINGKLVTLNILQILSKDLAEITSQHEYYTLTDPVNHRYWLDKFGGLLDEVDSFGYNYNLLKEKLSKLEAKKKVVTQKEERKEYIKYLLNRFEEINPQKNEETLLIEERTRLKNINKLFEGITQILNLLTLENYGVIDSISRISKILESISQFDTKNINQYHEEVETILIQLEEIKGELEKYINGLEQNPSKLDGIEDRLNKIYRLKKQFGVNTLEELFVKYKSLKEELDELEKVETVLFELESEISTLKNGIKERAKLISKKRKEVADALSKLITKELKDLGMGEAKIKVEVLPIESGEIEIDGTIINHFGMDYVEFLISTTPMGSLKPLRKIASGGELSRTALALKRIIGNLKQKSLYIFDEIDSGISGKTGVLIAQKLKEVGQNHQLIVVTHLPQIAAIGTTHYKVEKEFSQNNVNVRVKKLTHEERLKEIARLLCGDENNESFIDAARKLLEREIINY